MKILLKVPADIRQIPIDCKDKIATELFKHVKSQYDTQVHNQAYLANIDNGSPAENISLVLGAEHPETIKRTAENWNADRSREFDTALKTVNASRRGQSPDNWHNANTHALYALKKAAMTLDGDFFMFAEHALLINRYEYFTTIITDGQLRQILQIPGNYATMEVTPK